MEGWFLSLLLLFGLLIVGMASGLPVAFTFITINVVGLSLFLGGFNALSLLGGSAYNGIAQFALIPVPLFILMGELLMRSGLASATVDAADQWVGKVPGRLAISAVGGGTLFGALSGSSMASVAMLGSMLVPEMERQNYKPQMSVAPILGAGGLAVLIPPSALGVLLGALAKVSIAELLIAALLPGLVMAGFYGLYFIGRGYLQPHLAPPYESETLPILQRLKTLRHLVPLGGLVVVVTGFIFLGIATPSETAAMGAAASALLAAAYGRLTWTVLRESMMATLATTAMVMLIIVGSTAYSQLLAVTGVTSGLVEGVTELDLSPVMMVIVMQILVLILGCFIDTISIMLITIPIFMPIVQTLGMDPIWFSILILIQLELAGITPPFGVLLFVMKGVRPHLNIVDIYRAAFPIVLLQFLVIALVIVFPGLTSWLPSLMVRN